MSRHSRPAAPLALAEEGHRVCPTPRGAGGLTFHTHTHTHAYTHAHTLSLFRRLVFRDRHRRGWRAAAPAAARSSGRSNRSAMPGGHGSATRMHLDSWRKNGRIADSQASADGLRSRTGPRPGLVSAGTRSGTSGHRPCAGRSRRAHRRTRERSGGRRVETRARRTKHVEKKLGGGQEGKSGGFGPCRLVQHVA